MALNRQPVLVSKDTRANIVNRILMNAQSRSHVSTVSVSIRKDHIRAIVSQDLPDQTVISTLMNVFQIHVKTVQIVQI